MMGLRFRFNEDNLDERFAGNDFPAQYGHWNPALNEYVPGEDEHGESPTLLYWNSDYGWQAVHNPEDFGEIVEA